MSSSDAASQEDKQAVFPDFADAGGKQDQDQQSECFRPALTLTRLDGSSSESTNDFEAFRMTTSDRTDVEAIVAQSDNYQTKSEFYRVAVRELLRSEAEQELAAQEIQR